MAASQTYVLASMPSTKMPQAVLNKEHKMKVPYKLKQGQSRIFHELPSGLNMEVIYQKGVRTKTLDEKLWNPPPLVFVHGSFHAAWCWAEHWLPFFAQNGFDSYALSLLGQVQFSIQYRNFVVKVSIFVKFEGKLDQVFNCPKSQFSLKS